MDASAEDNFSEAERLMLARIAAAPEAWRARASSAGGFLGAAAAVSFWGLSNGTGELDEATRFFAGSAAALYVLAVIAFLVASVWPPPKPDETETTNYISTVHSYAAKESKPIKRLVLAGAGASALAIASTAACSFLLLTQERSTASRVAIVDSQAWDGVKSLCPTLRNPFAATIQNVENGVELALQEDECSGQEMVLTVQPSDVAVLQRGDSS